MLLTEGPIDFTTDLKSVEVLEGEDATFTCEVSKPNQEATWMIDGQEIQPNDKYEMVTDGTKFTLKIKNCSPEDSASVSILVKDCMSSAELTVKGTQHDALEFSLPFVFNALTVYTWRFKYWKTNLDK